MSSPPAPRFATPRRVERSTFGDRILLMMRRLGVEPMPWQRQVAEVGGEVDADGLPVYRTVVVTVPRQSGKTVLMLGWELDRAVWWDRAPTFGVLPQRVIYTMQSGLVAREKLLDDQVPVLQRRVPRLVSRVSRGMGIESVTFVTGSTLKLQATVHRSGHGRTATGLGVLDELWADTDNRRSAAIRPTMTTAVGPQLLETSTAGTAESVPLKAVVERGRQRCEDPGTSTAYFEWSADEDDDPSDEAVWWRVMPALGITQSVEAIRHEFEDMPEGEFRRAYLNQWWDTDQSVIPESAWLRVQSPTVRVADGPVFAGDATRDLRWASIVACDSQGRLELVENHPGTPWVGSRLLELVASHGGSVVVDGGGPLGYLVDEVDGCRRLSTSDMTSASQGFLDAVLSDRVRVFPSGRLDEAVKGAVRRPVSDRWIWSRDTGVDSSPLLAATVAWWAARGVEPEYDVLESVF